MKKSKIVVGLSGGVDSSVSAKILIDQGYEVIGVFMKNWEDSDDENCPAKQDALDARQVAEKLKIPFFTVNFSQEYWEQVFTYFLKEHRLLRTPNPDILCNKFIKFKCFLDYALELGADKIATGHYAGNFFNPETKCYELQIPADRNKDQTYFLHALNQEQLSKVIFPLENLCKDEVRKIAQQEEFLNADKKDSTGICFIGERNYREFLTKFIKGKKGEIITDTGISVGEHHGLSFYTIGQRRDLGVGGVRNAPEKPWFVIAKGVEKNQLIVSQDEDKLLVSNVFCNEIHWISGEENFPGKNSFPCLARVRYRQNSQPVEISWEEKEGKYRIDFGQSQRSIALGQSIVFYDLEDKICLGGGEMTGL